MEDQIAPACVSVLCYQSGTRMLIFTFWTLCVEEVPDLPRMNYADLVGQTLDEKYQIERELGRGGMGTVYLATHLGTERPVAIKVIAPQFMKRPEFVERFRREARAAGRLRHPNVVDVTDFGFADTDDGRVAYLVMEYLDGCTLGEILEEEKNLPVGWTLDILEQVCSAVQEAHEQGIIHRDLKPDNIWLEPNQRGGYTVKVLDFGIAKLDTHEAPETTDRRSSDLRIDVSAAKSTLADAAEHRTLNGPIVPTLAGGGDGTAMIKDIASTERETLIGESVAPGKANTLVLKAHAGGDGDQESVKTRLIGEPAPDIRTGVSANSSIGAPTTSNLTRVGSVLGTPLYMSPEQCRGDKLDQRSDIYGIGVIAYQMLSGDTPFSGDFTRVMESHKYLPPPNLNAKGVRKKLKQVILSALAKDANDRPQSAEAFANALRARSEGIFGLLRRAGMIWTEHIQKFLTLSIFFFLPIIATTCVAVVLAFLKASETIPPLAAEIAVGVTSLASFVLTAFSAFLIVGTITWIVTQSLAVPLRPIKLRMALAEARKKWKTFAGLGILTTLAPIILALITASIVFGCLFGILWLAIGSGTPAFLIAGISGSVLGIAVFFLVAVWLILVAPAAMMESLRGWQAIKRSKALISRSLATALAAYAIMFLIPMVTAGTLSFMVTTTAKAFEIQLPGAGDQPAGVSVTPANAEKGGDAKEKPIQFSLGKGVRTEIKDGAKDVRGRLLATLLETLLQILLLPIQIVTISFTSIIVALLYLKTRQAGGESLQDLLANFEESDKPRKKWQERVRQRLIQSGRITSRS